VRTWLAATIGAVILVGAGLGGYFIGAATHDHDNRPGASRFDHRPAPGPRDFPRFRDGGGGPNRGGTPG
jgi:hypothetical protein